MVKVVIVDDEEITRNGLAEFIDWDGLGVQIAGKAADGVEALELVKNVLPDIILCDVRMPRMDGITLAKQIKDLYPECKIIFLSGYSDVEYLKSAIKIKAVDYVEKPVDIEELEKLISRTVLLCKEEKDRKHLEQELLLNVERSIPYLRSKLVESLLRGGDIDFDSIRNNLRFIGIDFPLEGSYLCCVADFQDPSKAEGSLGVINETIAGHIPVYISTNVNGQTVIIFTLSSSSGLPLISACCSEAVKAVKGALKTDVTVGMGSVVHCAADIAHSYANALEALRYLFYHGRNAVIRYNDVAGSSSPTLIFDKQQYTLLEDCLKKKNIDSASEIVENIIMDLEKNNSSNIDQVRKGLFNIYLLISSIYIENIFEIENNNDILRARLFMTGELSTIRKFIRSKLMAIEYRITLEKSSSVKSVIKRIEDYIEQNYNRDISINSISNEVYLTPTYLCLLFKKEKGETINEHITRLRVAKAKEFLRDRRVKLYEVACKVGYHDSNYFAKVFKKITGLNPSDYRDRL